MEPAASSTCEDRSIIDDSMVFPELEAPLDVVRGKVSVNSEIRVDTLIGQPVAGQFGRQDRGKRCVFAFHNGAAPP